MMNAAERDGCLEYGHRSAFFEKPTNFCGNQQKIVIAREVEQTQISFDRPTDTGVDIGAIEKITRKQIVETKGLSQRLFVGFCEIAG